MKYYEITQEKIDTCIGKCDGYNVFLAKMNKPVFSFNFHCIYDFLQAALHSISTPSLRSVNDQQNLISLFRPVACQIVWRWHNVAILLLAIYTVGGAVSL